MSQPERVIKHVENISSAFEQILNLSQQARLLLEASDSGRQTMVNYLKINKRRLELMNRIEKREKQIQGLTGRDEPPYQYEAEVFYDEILYQTYSGQVKRIRAMIAEILANDKVSEQCLKKQLDETGSRLQRMEGSRKAAAAYNYGGPPPPAWFFDRKK